MIRHEKKIKQNVKIQFFFRIKSFFFQEERTIYLLTTLLLITRNYKSPYQIELIKLGRLKSRVTNGSSKCKKAEKNA